MRALLIVLLISFSGLSQEPILTISKDELPVAKKHILEARPISLYFNKGFFIGQGLSYQWNFANDLSLNVSTDGTILGSLDRRIKQHGSNGIAPKLNESEVSVSYRLLKRLYQLKKKKLISSQLSGSLGYHFFRQGMPYNEYWGIDSSVQNGLTVISGTQSHSVMAGLQFERTRFHNEKDNSRFRWSHSVGLKYYGNVHFQLKGYDQNDQSNFNYRKLQNDFPVQRHGAKLNYRFTHALGENVNAYVHTDVAYMPFFEYKYNPAYHVPRGGEGLIPVFSSLKFGLQVKL